MPSAQFEAQMTERLIDIAERLGRIEAGQDNMIQRIDAHEATDLAAFERQEKITSAQFEAVHSDIRGLRETAAELRKADTSAQFEMVSAARADAVAAKTELATRRESAHSWIRSLIPVSVSLGLGLLSLAVSLYLAFRK